MRKRDAVSYILVAVALFCAGMNTGAGFVSTPIDIAAVTHGFGLMLLEIVLLMLLMQNNRFSR